LGAGPRPADAGQPAASPPAPPPPPSPVPVAVTVIAVGGSRFHVQCGHCGHSGPVTNRQDEPSVRCPRCLSDNVIPSPQVIEPIVRHAGRTPRQPMAVELVAITEDIEFQLARLTAGDGRGTMEGGRSVGDTERAVVVGPGGARSEPEPEPEPEPAPRSAAPTIGSGASSLPTVHGDGGAGDRPVQGTPEGDTGHDDDDVDWLERIVAERRQRDAEREHDPVAIVEDAERQRACLETVGRGA